MSSPLQIPPPGFDELSIDEQWAYVEELLSYVYEHGAAEIPEWHRKILDERMARYRADGFTGTTWEEFEQELAEK